MKRIRRTKTYDISKMYCTRCGKEGIPIPRRGNKREAGHLKNLFCIYCNDLVNHAEIKPNDSKYTYKDFMLEMKYNNFDEAGNRKEPYRIFRGNLKKEGII